VLGMSSCWIISFAIFWFVIGKISFPV